MSSRGVRGSQVLKDKSKKQAREKPVTKEESWDDAERLRLEKNYKGAVVAYTHVLKFEPENIEGLKYRCVCQMRTRKLEQADADAFKLQQLMPECSLGYSLRGRVFVCLRQYGKASYEFQLALSVEPDIQVQKLKLWTDSIITLTLRDHIKTQRKALHGRDLFAEEEDVVLPANLRLLEEELQEAASVPLARRRIEAWRRGVDPGLVFGSMKTRTRGRPRGRE